jgi:hypothetical protein
MASDLPLVFLDADVLARPVTRTLLIGGGDKAEVTLTWSDFARSKRIGISERTQPL